MTNKPMLSVELKLNDRQECDLIRFHETCEDSQPYDVSKEGIKSLARIGLVRSLWFSRYELTDVGSAAVYKLLEFLRSKPASRHQGEPVAWSYCPECGCEELHHEEGEHKQCANCHQEWFSDINYSEVVRGNLQKLKSEQPAPVSVVMPDRESFDIDDWAGSFCQEALSFGINQDVFARCVRAAISRTLAEVARLNGVKP